MSLKRLFTIFLFNLIIKHSYSQLFLGEIRMFAGRYAPRGWALCNGQTLPINQNSALFSILGTSYGGDGKSTFKLPDLSGRTPISKSDNHPLGSIGGSETIILQAVNLPSHTHTATVSLSVPGFDLPLYTAKTDIDVSSLKTKFRSISLASQTCPVSRKLDTDSPIPIALGVGKWEQRRWDRQCRKEPDSCSFAARMYLVPQEFVIEATPEPSDNEGSGAKCEAQSVPLSEDTLKGTATATTTLNADSNSVEKRNVQGSVTVNAAGTGSALNSRDPYLVVNYIIAVTGMLPSQS